MRCDLDLRAGRIEVLVRDEAGARIRGATVTLTTADRSSPDRYEAATDARGRVVAAELAYASWIVAVECEHYLPSRRTWRRPRRHAPAATELFWWEKASSLALCHVGPAGRRLPISAALRRSVTFAPTGEVLQATNQRALAGGRRPTELVFDRIRPGSYRIAKDEWSQPDSERALRYPADRDPRGAPRRRAAR